MGDLVGMRELEVHGSFGMVVECSVGGACLVT